MSNQKSNKAWLSVPSANSLNFLINNMKYSPYVSGGRMFFLSILSLGSFPVVLMYRQWKFVELYHNQNVTPLLRAVFCFFFIPSLGRHLNEMLEEQGESFRTHGWVTWFLLVIMGITPYLNLFRFFALFRFNDAVVVIEENQEKPHLLPRPLWKDLLVAVLMGFLSFIIVFVSTT